MIIYKRCSEYLYMEMKQLIIASRTPLGGSWGISFRERMAEHVNKSAPIATIDVGQGWKEN